MSRVYDVPRYRDQTLHKVLLHLHVARKYNDDYGRSNQDVDLAIRSLADASIKDKSLDENLYILTLYQIIDSKSVDCMSAEEVDNADEYTQYYVNEAVMRPGTDQFSTAACFGNALARILARSQQGSVYCDSAAHFRVCSRYLGMKTVAKMHNKDAAISTRADTMARDICSVSIAACRLGLRVLKKMQTQVKKSGETGRVHQAMRAWNKGIEQIRMKSATPNVSNAHERVRGLDFDVPPELFETTTTRGARTLCVRESFRILGLTILSYDKETYVLDFPSIDQVHCVSKMWEGFYAFGHDYKLSGGYADESDDYIGWLDSCRMFIHSALQLTGHSEYLARSMKQSLALLQNELHKDRETLNVNTDSKSRQLRKDIADILELPVYWHDMLLSLDCSDRQRLDLANLFYGLPSPDCELKELFKRASVLMQHPNIADAQEFGEFMKYCKSYDMCKALAIYGDGLQYKTVPDYDPKEEIWYKRCKKGALTLPPEEDLGKAWIEGHFPFNDSIESWYWEASDVTHISANLSNYDSLVTATEIPRNEHNELLYALEHAPKLSGKYTPSDVHDRLATFRDCWSRIAVMAVKNENTKPGPKGRETWSGDDCTRELFSTYDRAGIPLASLYAGVTARKSDIQVRGIFDRICNLTRPDSGNRVIIMSNDVSGWSPQADRKAWSEHHDYVVRTTKCPRHLTMAKILGNIHAVLNKRGILAKQTLAYALFQGWTGTLDSLLNVRMSLYCVRKAKRAGLLSDKEGATTAGLIDDAVQAVELDPGKTKEEHQRVADSHFQTTYDTWKKLAAKLDPVKTIYSSIKFIYLNEFYCEGSQILTPGKIFARSDKEYNRRFAPVYSQIDTILGAYLAAVGKGACPMTSYFHAVRRCLEIIIMSNRTILNARPEIILNAAFAPRGLGGWGFPHIIGWLTSENEDPLTMYTAIMTSAIDSIPDEHIRGALSSLLEQTLGQPKQVVRILQLVDDPKKVVAVGVVDPMSSVYSKIKRGMIGKCKSQVFRSALTSGGLDDCSDNFAECVRSCTWDAAILELLGQCLPTACSAALVDRAYKNELVTQLFPFGVRSELSRLVRNSSRVALAHLLHLDFTVPLQKYSRSDAYGLAYDCREEFYSVNEISVINHTLPDYCTFLARQPDDYTSGVKFVCEPPKKSCPHEIAKDRSYDPAVNDRLKASMYMDMYDGMPPKGGLTVRRSGSAFTFTGERFRDMTPVQRCINKAAMVTGYVSSTGGCGRAFWDIVMAAWGAPEVTIVPETTMHIKAGASTKRLSPSQAKTTHRIACFKNVHGCVTVDSGPLGRYLNSVSSHVDYMSFVTVCRTIGLLEMACVDNVESIKGLSANYGFLDGSLPETVKGTIKMDDSENFKFNVMEMMKHGNQDLYESVLKSMNEVIKPADKEDIFPRVEYVPNAGEVPLSSSTITSHGYISMIIRPGAILPTTDLKVRPVRVIRGDEISSNPVASMDVRFRKMCTYVGESQAILCCMMEQLRTDTKGSPNMRVLSSSWSYIGKAVEVEMPDYERLWDNLRRMALARVMWIDYSLCEMVMGRVSGRYVSALSGLGRCQKEISANIIGKLYAAAFGRMTTKEGYRITSVMGKEYIGRAWAISAKIKRYQFNHGRKFSNLQYMSYVYESLSKNLKTSNTRAEIVSSIDLGVSRYSAMLKRDFVRTSIQEITDMFEIGGYNYALLNIFIDRLLEPLDMAGRPKAREDLEDVFEDIHNMDQIVNIPVDSKASAVKVELQPAGYDAIEGNIEKLTSFEVQDMGDEEEEQAPAEPARTEENTTMNQSPGRSTTRTISESIVLPCTSTPKAMKAEEELEPMRQCSAREISSLDSAYETYKVERDLYLAREKRRKAMRREKQRRFEKLFMRSSQSNVSPPFSSAPEGWGRVPVHGQKGKPRWQDANSFGLDKPVWDEEKGMYFAHAKACPNNPRNKARTSKVEETWTNVDFEDKEYLSLWQRASLSIRWWCEGLISKL